jgi:hypothetical protein
MAAMSHVAARTSPIERAASVVNRCPGVEIISTRRNPARAISSGSRSSAPAAKTTRRAGWS